MIFFICHKLLIIDKHISCNGILYILYRTNKVIGKLAKEISLILTSYVHKL